MPDLLQAGFEWLEGERDAQLSHPVVYYQPSTGYSVVLNATVGRTLYQVPDVTRQFMIERETRDFLVRTVALALNGQVTTPLIGDTITETINGGQWLYQVTMIQYQGTQAHWRWSDPNKLTRRIHTLAITATT